jgi:hypothetical protein
MNVQFRELADQADIVFGFDKAGNEEVICAPTDIEKFAELIVKECARVVLEDPEKTGIRMYFDEKIAAYVIKKHFGV